MLLEECAFRIIPTWSMFDIWIPPRVLCTFSPRILVLIYVLLVCTGEFRLRLCKVLNYRDPHGEGLVSVNLPTGRHGWYKFHWLCLSISGKIFNHISWSFWLMFSQTKWLRLLFVVSVNPPNGRHGWYKFTLIFLFHFRKIFNYISRSFSTYALLPRRWALRL
jgi:hypothetical protein